jgi:hypothetical protein
MSRERLRALREQAERLDPEIKTAALLRIARVEAAFDRAKALRTFDAALDTLGKIEGTNRQFLNGRARMIAAAIAPERLDTIPSEQRVAIRVWTTNNSFARWSIMDTGTQPFLTLCGLAKLQNFLSAWFPHCCTRPLTAKLVPRYCEAR